MALTYNKTNRDLSIKGTITLTTGEQIPLTAADVVSYSGNCATGVEGLQLGSTEAASFSLVLDNAGRRFNPEQLDNAEVHMFLGIKDDADYTYTDFGVWLVSDTTAPEQSVTITLNGYDILAYRFEAEYTDDSSVYPGATIYDIVETICVAGGTRLARKDFPNAALVIQKMPTWEEGTTLRNILGYCAIFAGGFVRITRNGMLDIVSYAEGTEYNVGPDLYRTFTPSGGSPFAFNRLEAFMDEEDEDSTPFYIDPDVEPNATNTIQLEYNPLLDKTITYKNPGGAVLTPTQVLNSVVTLLSGIVLDPGEVGWGGDPSVLCGDRFIVSDLKGNAHKIMVNSQTFDFGGGLSFTDSCSLPSVNSVKGQTYSTGTNMYTADGKINATRISGLNQSIVRATVGHFERLTSESIETDKLVASLISALELRAQAITADDVSTDKMTAIVAEILEASIDAVNAGEITTNKLYADIAEMLALKVGSIKAEDIETDKLASVLATFTTLAAKTANFDLAAAKNLLSDALILQEGVADSMMITNLAITSANIASATLGELVLKGEGDTYYNVFVGSDGVIRTEEVTVSTDELEAGQTSNGKQIVATTANIDALNTQTIKGQSAIIAEIFTDALTAGKITATQAFISSATIPELAVTAVNAIGDSMDLTANESINFLIKTEEDVRKWMTFNDDGLIIRKPSYKDADGVEHEPIYYTRTDENGYHVRRVDLAEDVFSAEGEGVVTNSMRIGEIACRRTSTGGWVWDVAD